MNTRLTLLPATSDVRAWNDEVEKTFALYDDTIVLGIRKHLRGAVVAAALVLAAPTPGGTP